MLPDIYNQHLAGSQGKQSALPLEVLVFPSFSTISTLHIHDQYVVRHVLGICIGPSSLILRHPYSFGSLPPVILRHDAEFGAKKMVQECRFSGRLGSEDGDEVVVETGRKDFLEG